MPTIVSARKFLDSNAVYSTDWSHYAKPACDCIDHNTHTCVEPIKQWQDVFRMIRINNAFIEHILFYGVMQPIGFDQERGYVFNGHHRLTVAYKYNMYVPITFNHEPFNMTENDDLPSGW